MTAPALRIKRIYEPATDDDGFRVLVDRLWPRGIAKDKARIDQWLREIAPSDMLRKGVHGGTIGWDAFVAAYGRELEREPASTAAASLRDRICRQPVTLLYSARDEIHNNAIALKAWLEKRS